MKTIELRMQYVTLGYLTLPILLFFLSWLQLGYGLFFSSLLLYGTWRFLRSIKEDSDSGPTKIGWQGWLIIVVAFGWVFLSGVGSFANQDWDHHWRNAIFRDLIRYDWPVYYSFKPTYRLDLLAGQRPAFNYYFTFWLPAALLGKLGGQSMGNVALLLWTYVGTLLVLYYLNRLFGFRYTLAVSLLFVGWSGLDLLGKIGLQKHIPTYDEVIEMYAPYFYTAFTTDLQHVFHQTIPAWLATLFILNFWRRVPLVPVLLIVAYAPFPFIGLALFWVTYYLSDRLAAGQSVGGVVQQVVTELLTAGNVAVLIAVLVPYGLFYGAHTGTVPSASYWGRFFTHDLLENVKQLIIYVAAYFLEVGVYLGLIWLLSPNTYRKNRLLFWLCAGWLLLLPVWVVGVYNDFASRASIPALTVLCVLTIRALLDPYARRPTGYRLALASLVLVISWVTPIRAIVRGIPFDGVPDLREAIVTFADPAITQDKDPQGFYVNLGFYYAFEPQKHFFYKYLVRR